MERNTTFICEQNKQGVASQSSETDSGEILQCKPEIDIENGEGKGIAIEKGELYEEEKNFDRLKKEDGAEIGNKERQDGVSLEAARSSNYNLTLYYSNFNNNATKLMRNETTEQETFFPIKPNKLPIVCSSHPIFTLEIDQPLPFRYGYFGLKQGVDQTIELEGDINPEKEGESQQRLNIIPSSNETSEGKQEEYKPHFAVPLEKHDEKTEFGKAEAVLDRSPLDVALNKQRRKGVTWRRLFRCILQWLFKLCIGLGFIFCIYLFFSEVQRTKRNTGGNNYHVTKYKLLIDGVECPLVKSIRCEKDGEKPVCIRNKTRKNLVIACVTNITMTNGCPVFVKAKNATHVDLTLVQFEDIINCSSCPTEVYGLHDVENYPTCLTLDTPLTTTDASAITTNPAVKKKQDANVLHGGIIAGIVVAFTVLVVLLVVLVILLIFYGFRRMMEMICQTSQMIPIPQSDFV